MKDNKTEVIIVGAGPAGIAAGITLARLGKKVVILERGNYPGSKNMFGGAIYEYPAAEIYPSFKTDAPIQRINTEHRYIIADKSSAVSVSYKKDNPNQVSYTVIRSEWDKWCAERAVELGAYLCVKTAVRELIISAGKVIGVKTDKEEFYSDIVILADGVNSLLAKQAGLRKKLKDSETAIGIKEVIKLPKSVIEERFQLSEQTGCVIEIIGGPMKGMTGLGFMYTNKNSIALGLGVNLDELVKHKIKPNDLLNELKEHPSIAPLIKDGELIEYSAHLIPEGGYNALPVLAGDGVMVVGDAAMLVNNVHWEGTNLAMMSGKIAADVAYEALEAGDCSLGILSRYEKKLKDTFVYKDIKTYREAVPTIHANAESMLGYWPEKINEFFEMFTSSGYIPKSALYRRYLKNFIKNRKISCLCKDVIEFVKLGIGIIT